MDKSESFYEAAHDFVAAVRVLARTNGVPPSVEDVCQLFRQSGEWGGLIARKLVRLGIVREVTTPYGAKLYVADHLKLEGIAREEADAGLGREIESYRKSRADTGKKVEAIQAELARKKQELFADLQEKLKQKK